VFTPVAPLHRDEFVFCVVPMLNPDGVVIVVVVVVVLVLVLGIIVVVISVVVVVVVSRSSYSHLSLLITGTILSFA